MLAGIVTIPMAVLLVAWWLCTPVFRSTASRGIHFRPDPDEHDPGDHCRDLVALGLKFIPEKMINGFQILPNSSLH